MDELIFEGEKYISSRRAAEVTGYAKDYIGQLCRSGKVRARLVGRTWYVEEAAILAYRRLPKEAKPIGHEMEGQPEWTDHKVASSGILMNSGHIISDTQENILTEPQISVESESLSSEIRNTQQVKKLEEHGDAKEESAQREISQGLDLATAREIMLATILKKSREEVVLPKRDGWPSNSYLAKTITVVLLAFFLSTGLNMLLVGVYTATAGSLSSEVKVIALASSIASLKSYFESFARGK